jgi:5-methylcytosine-specific restriction endonuclease McrA
MPPDPRPAPRKKDPDLMKRLHLELHGEPCEVCGRRPGKHLHHSRFRSHGGSDTRENLIWICRTCHDLAHGL